MTYGLRPGARRAIDLGTRRGLSVGELAQAMPPGTVAPPKQQQEQIGAQAREMATGDAEALALADALGADAFRPTEAPGALTGIARVVELLTQHRGNLRERQEAQGAERTEEKRDLARRQALTEAVRAYSATGDANALVSALADADPEQGLDLATTLAGREAQRQPDWQIDPATGRPYSIQGGNVQFGQGNITPARRPGSDGTRAPPPGYRWTSNGDLEAVRGGPADVRATESGSRRAAAMQDSADNLANVVSAIDEALPLVNEDTTGVWSTRAGEWGFNQGNVDLQAAIDPIKANLGFEALQEMRRNSETGGALGQVAVQELAMLQRVVRNLETSQSGTQLSRNLATVRAQVIRARQAVLAARAEMAPASGQQQPQSGNAVPVIELEP